MPEEKEPVRCWKCGSDEVVLNIIRHKGKDWHRCCKCREVFRESDYKP